MNVKIDLPLVYIKQQRGIMQGINFVQQLFNFNQIVLITALPIVEQKMWELAISFMERYEFTGVSTPNIRMGASISCLQLSPVYIYPQQI